MLRILHLVSAPFPEYNGTTARLLGLLSKLPYEIVLIIPNSTMKGNIIESKEEYFRNIKIKRALLSRQGIFKKNPIRYIHSIYQAPKIVFNSAKSEKFDIIHAHDSSLFLRAAKKLSIKLNKPLIIEFHAVRKDYVPNMVIPAFRMEIPCSGRIIDTYYEERKIKDALNYCTRVITLTQPLKSWICNYYKIKKNNVTVVPNGVDINKFTPRYKESSERKKEILNLSNKVVMYAGVLNQINGIREFANIIPSIITERSDTSFVFIGHGPEEDKIFALSKKYPQVKLLPMVPYEEMPLYYQMCDVFVIPRPSTISAETVTPLKLLEVMAMEKPVLGSNVGGIAEVIKHGENGYLFEKGNMESFKRTLLELLDTDNTQIGRNARKTIVDNYTWDKSAKILQKVYEELV
jgi:glycosyltransferase involved in cell wall biosynthesis